MSDRRVRLEAPPWASAVLVCERCQHGAGKRMVKPLKSALRERMGRRGARVALVGCLDVCPKRDVAVLCVGPLGPTVAVVEPGVDPEDLARALTPCLRAPG
jgi:hypothetical protein